MMFLNDEITTLKGIGKKKSLCYAGLGINTIGDFLYHFPRDYEDRSREKHIYEITAGEVALVRGTVIEVKKNNFPYARGKKQLLRVSISDGIQVMEAIYFNAYYLSDKLKKGEEYYFYGRVRTNEHPKQMIHPDFSKERPGIVPVYPLTKGITQKDIRRHISGVVNLADEIGEYLPKHVIKKHDLVDISFALKNIHLPGDIESLNLAKKRIIYDEMFFLELGLFMMKLTSGKGQRHEGDIEAFIKTLPYQLTSAQKKVVDEISRDMESDIAMSRLLQGDVGSGKTAVAEIAMYKAVRSGCQAAFMVPTDVLMKQHYGNLKNHFEKHEIKVSYLSGGMKSSEKASVIKSLKAGEIDIIVGTHALIQPDVEFFNLGLVITDEQHRFGVSQRKLLNEKGESPDILIMTATPIPRTLAMVIYGDTDISIIDELPPGRKQIITTCVLRKAEKKVYDIVLGEVIKGRQAYIVAPLIEESVAVDAKSAVELFEELKKRFSGYCVGLLHGGMSREEKDAVMLDFAEGKIKILVSTVVIEVGIDVPNATIMVIENCERFGLAQMHQLRGRVGRGARQSYCFLIMGNSSEIAVERAKVMCESNDGFLISEKDLDLRGPGDVFGTRQHGILDTHLTEMVKHMDVMEELRDTVIEILREDPDLSSEKNSELNERVYGMFGKDIGLNL